LTDKSVMLVAGAVMVGVAGLSLLSPILPIHLGRQLAASPAAIGLVFGVETASFAAGSAVIGWFTGRWSRRWMIVIGLAVLALLIPVAGVPPSLLVEGAVMATLGVAFSLVLVPTLPELAA